MTTSMKDSSKNFNVPLLSREGFSEWKMTMHALFQVHDLMGIITGQERSPEKPKFKKVTTRASLTKKFENSKIQVYEQKLKKHKDKKHKAWLFLVLACGISWSSLISRFEDHCKVRSAWKAILDQFGHGSSQLNAHQTEKMFSSVKMTPLLVLMLIC